MTVEAGRVRSVKVRWDWKETPAEPVRRLQEELSLDPLLARLLVQRGLEEAAAARAFLSPSLSDLHDPLRMKDMGRVVERLQSAILQQEPILIHGDYDVDGITSTAVLKRALEMLGARVGYHLPHRLQEGYGVRPQIVREAAAQGYGVLITVDSGIRALEPARLARELGLDLIITDHHLPGESLPEAYAILNPRRADCPYPDKNLAAVGVAFKLVEALFVPAGREEQVPHFLKLVALGTAADAVPLLGENRVLVSLGLEALSRPHNTGLKALLEGCDVGREVQVFDLTFKLAPRINAVTRMGGRNEVVELFSTRDRAKAAAIVQEMNRRNGERQREEARILEQVEEQLASRPELLERHFPVLMGKSWHRGVLGIVASRMVERLHRPVLVLSADGNSCQGSGRSIPGFNMVAALDACRGMFERYGGHAQAVGCTLAAPDAASQVEELSERLDEYARRVLTPPLLEPSLAIDAPLDPSQVSLELCRQLQKLAPFGSGNPTPVFASRAARVAAGPWVLKGRHLKFLLHANGGRVDAIWWRRGDCAASLKNQPKLDLAYTVSCQSFRGEEKLLLTVRDIRQAHGGNH